MQEDFGRYAIKSKHSGKAMDICQDTDKRGTLIIYDFYGGDNQIFMLKPNGVEVEIVSKQTGKSLSVVDGSDKNGVPILESDGNDSQPQKFRFQ